MAQKIQLPDGTFFPMKEGETPEQALMVAASFYPEAFKPREEAPKQDTTGLKAAAASGFERLGGEFELLKGKLGVKSEAEAQKEYEAAKKRAQARFTPTEKGWTEDPFLKFRETLGGSLPYMALPATAGIAALAAPVSAPVAAGLGLLGAGAVSAGQFTGSNLAAQLETGKTLEQASGTAALAAAIPQALVDTAAMALLPGVGKLFSSVGSKLTTAEAKAIAEQTFRKAAADYTAKTGLAMGREGFTETVQQVLERLQAGTSLTDADARKEYIDSFIGGAVLAGAVSPAGRYIERSGARKQAEEADAQDKAAAKAAAAQAKAAADAAEEARKQTPEYMRQAVAESAALEKQKRDLQAQIIRAPKGETLTEEQKQANAVVNAQLKELAPKLTEAAKESNRVKPLLAKLDEEARLAGMSPEEFMLEQTFRGPGMQLPKGGRFETRPEEETAPPKPSAVEQYIQQQTEAAKEAGALTLPDTVDYLMRDPAMAQEIVRTRMAVPGLTKQENKALIGGLELQLKELDKQRAAASRAATGAAQQRLSTVEAEEQAALEESQRQQAALDAETARERKIAPEILAQRRIAARPVTGFDQVAGLVSQLPLEGAAPEPGGSSVMGRTAQELQGLPIGAEGQPIYTAEEEKAPPPAPVPQRVKGEFRLFNERGEPVRPSDVASIQERLARVLAEKELDQDAYDFLRRAEDIVPTASPEVLSLLDRQLSLIEQGKEGIVAPGAPRPATLQAFPTRPTRAEVAAPTMADLRDIQKNASADPRTLTALQRKRAEAYNRYINEGKSPAQAAGYAYREALIKQPEGERVAAEAGEVPVTKRASDITPRTLRGPSRAAAPLSFAQELEPLMRSAEEAAGTGPLDTAQMPLFEEAQAELGIAFTTPEEFAAFLRSPEANRMRGALELANETLNKIGKLPEMQQRVKELTARVEQLTKTLQTIKGLKALTTNRNAILQASEQATKLNETITNFVVGRMSLAPRIEELTAHKARLEEMLKARSMPGMRAKGKLAPAVAQTDNLKKELSDVLARLEAAQDVMARTQAGAKRAQTMLRVLAAENKMAEIMQVGSEAATVAMFPQSVIENAQKDLQAAIAELEPVQKKEAEQRLAAMVKAGEDRRAAAAVDRAKAEEARNAARKEEQRRLEERFADSVDRQEITALDTAQRDSREMGPPTFNPVELDGLEKDPVQVLGGYRSAITALEAQVRKSQERSKQARLSQLDALKAKVNDLEKQYRAAKTADERAALIPQIEAATADYAAKAERLNAQSLTWKGMASQIKQLADLYNKVDFLEAKVGPNGEFAASVLADKDQFRALLNKEARAERARLKREKKAAAKKAAAQAEAAEAASRVGAPATTGEALTRTEAAEARKAKKTLYSSKGVGPVETKTEERTVAPTEEAPTTITRTLEPDGGVRTVAQKSVGGKLQTRKDVTRYYYKATIDGEPQNIVVERNNLTGETEAFTVVEGRPVGSGLAIKALVQSGVSPEEALKRVIPDLTRLKPDTAAAKASVKAQEKRNTVAMVYTTATRTESNPAVREAILDGRLVEALDRLAVEGANDLIKASAAELRSLVLRTKINIDPNLTVDGEAVPASFGVDTNTISFRPTEITDEDIIHEATHAATMRVLRMPEANLTPRQLAAKREIEAIFADLKENRSDIAREYGLKDIEEFVSEVQSNVEFRAAIDKQPWYQKLWNAIVRLFSDAPQEAVSERASRLIREIYLPSKKIQGAGATTVPSVFRKTSPEFESENALTELSKKIIAQPEGFIERNKSNLALKAEMNAVDMRAGLQEALKRGAKELGNDNLFTQAMYNVRKADQFMPMVYTALTNGPHEFYTDDKGLRGIKSSNQNNAQDVFTAVKNVSGKNTEAKFALASTYMIAQRAANKGLSKLDLGELGVTEAELAAAMAAADADPALKSALEEVRRRYNAYNEGQIKFLADAGVISKADAKAWLKDGDYVPYYRVRKDGTAELVFGGEKTLTIGDIRTQPYLAELKGGETKILPLNESLIRNTMLITRAALTNNATKEIAYAMQAFGEGKGPEGKNSMPIQRGQGPDGKDIIRFKQEPDPRDPKDDGKRWLRINTKNTAMEGIPSELVVKSLEGAHLTLPAFLKIGGIAGDWLRKGVTRMPPYIFRQLIRDPMAASFTGGLNYGPFRAVVMAGTEFLRSSAGRSETAKKLIEKGLIQSGVFTGDPDDMSAFATQLASGKDGPAIDRFFGMLDRAAMRADAATRALVHENAIKNGLSEVEADMMTMESMNFYKRGLSPTVQYANRLIPFMNAQIQGLNVLVKAMRGNMPFEERQRIQRKFWNNAVMLFGVGIAYAMAMDDDDTFKNAKPRDKYTNFFVNMPGVSEAVKIPLPYESGWFFSAAVALADAMKAETNNEQQLKALKDIFLSAVPGYSSLGMPQAIKPLLEVYTNKNFFSGQNIESQSMQGRSPEERFNASTTEAAKALAKVLPFSPVQIEHIARGYFGTAPLAMMSVASGFMREDTKGAAPERRLSEMPIVGTVFQKKYGGADADTMYAFAKEATQRAASLKDIQKNGTPQDYKEYLANHRTEIMLAPMARNFEMLLGRLRTQEDVVRNRKDLNEGEKRARLDQLDKVRQDLANKFNAAVRKVEAARAS